MKYIALVFLSVFSYSNAMEEVCYLNLMPQEALNLIAHFLTCDDETEEQFITRTERDSVAFMLGQICNKCWVRCPYKIKRMEIIQTLHDNSRSHVKTQDLVIKIGKNDKYKKEIPLVKYECIALSSGGNRIAYHYHVPQGRSEQDKCNLLLVVEKHDLQKNEQGEGIIVRRKQGTFELDFEPTWVGFNQQGTHLIARQDHRGSKQHEIFSLKNREEGVVILPTTNQLQEYLRDKCVCNAYIEGKK